MALKILLEEAFQKLLALFPTHPEFREIKLDQITTLVDRVYDKLNKNTIETVKETAQKKSESEEEIKIVCKIIY